MKRIITWLPTLSWALLIFYLSSIPSLKATDNFLIQNIINISAHFTEYFVLTLLLYRSLRHEEFSLPISTSAYISTLFSLSDEFHQNFVIGRTTDLKDILIDLTGIIVAVWLLRKRKVK